MRELPKRVLQAVNDSEMGQQANEGGSHGLCLGRQSIAVEAVTAEARRRYIKEHLVLADVRLEKHKRLFANASDGPVVLGCLTNHGKRALRVVQLSVWSLD